MEIKVKYEKINLKKLENFTKILNKGLRSGIQRAIFFLRDEIVRNLSIGKFGIKTDTGKLKGSFETKMEGEGSNVRGIVGSNLVYAAIHEYGGKINVSRKMAGFAWWRFGVTKDDMWKAIALLKGRQVKMPARHYVENTLRKNKDKVLRLVEQSIMQGLN